jgi:hypothetical protein
VNASSWCWISSRSSTLPAPGLQMMQVFTFKVGARPISQGGAQQQRECVLLVRGGEVPALLRSRLPLKFPAPPAAGTRVMSFTIRQETSDAPDVSPAAEAGDGSFRLSTAPVVSARPAAEREDLGGELPRSYGTQNLYLIPRDPQTIYAYWDVDWENAFVGDPPSDRKVYLRVHNGEAGETTIAVEPMAGYCYVDVTDGDAAYTAELGYFQPAGNWNVIATSDAVTTPADAITTGPADFATVPFHLSFQGMVDALRRARQESAALTAMLDDLRQRAASATERSIFTPGEQEIATAIDNAAPPRPAPTTASLPQGINRPNDLWASPSLSRIRSITAGSSRGASGGSSRPA